MLSIALKMLLGVEDKYPVIITGSALASLLMIHQPGSLIPILSHAYSFMSDVNLTHIWVMDPKVKFSDDCRPLLDTQLYRVRGVRGVRWAVLFYEGSQRVGLDRVELVCYNLLGLDNATPI